MKRIARCTTCNTKIRNQDYWFPCFMCKQLFKPPQGTHMKCSGKLRMVILCREDLGGEFPKFVPICSEECEAALNIVHMGKVIPRISAGARARVTKYNNYEPRLNLHHQPNPNHK